MTSPSDRSAAATKLIVSDLHLGDGVPSTESWRADQELAWKRLLHAAMPDGELAAGPVELIINGDCFDFLVVPPNLGARTHTEAAIGLAKIERVIAAHRAWFAALAAFLAAPDHTVAFLIGNHDVELAFAGVRARIRAAIGAAEGRVRFCLARAYRPISDVEVEHGCQFDPWNRIPGLWDAPGWAVSSGPEELEATDAVDTAEPTQLPLPWGSRYYYHVLAPINRRFPYLDALLPAPSQASVLALLCLYAPQLVVTGSARAHELREDPAAAPPPLAQLARSAEDGPAALFGAALPDVVAIQEEVWRRAEILATADSSAAPDAYARLLQVTLAEGELPALRAIFIPPATATPGMPAIDAAAAVAMLARDPALRLALCGHTHAEGSYLVVRPDGATGIFVNTGTWYPRLAAPSPAAIDDALARWLRYPDSAPSPLAPATAFTYALLRASPDEPTTAALRQARPHA